MIIYRTTSFLLKNKLKNNFDQQSFEFQEYHLMHSNKFENYHRPVFPSDQQQDISI
jgi:hypothetical protein